MENEFELYVVYSISAILRFASVVSSLTCFHLSVDRRIGTDKLPVFGRPVDCNGLSYYITLRNAAPIARIVADWSIIAQHEIFTGRNFPGIRYHCRGCTDIWFVEWHAVDGNMVGIYLNRITRQADDTLNKIDAGIVGIMEDDHITPFGRMDEVESFIDQHVLIVLERGLHACALDVIALDNKANDKEYEKREDNRFDDFSRQM